MTSQGLPRLLTILGSFIRKGDLGGALKKVPGEPKIGEEIGDKSGIATSLNNIGWVLDTKGDLDGALKSTMRA